VTRLLVSVTSVEEALLAVEAGADIIDLKDPSQGALGALPLPLAAEIVEVLAGRKPVSATIGDLPMVPELIRDAVMATAQTGVDFVKIGLFEQADRQQQCIEALAPVAEEGARLIAVLFADAGVSLELVDALARAGFHGVMLDTARKDGCRLTDCMTIQELREFVRQAQAARLLTGLAGSLAIDDIALLYPLDADYLGFRGGLCRASQRRGELDRQRLQNALNVLYLCNKPEWASV